MGLELPPCSTPDVHFVLRLAVYPEWSKLTAVTYKLSGSRPSPSSALFSPRTLERPSDEWDIIQSLSLGIDILMAKRFS